MMLVTDLAVLDVSGNAFTLVELAPGVTVEEVKEKTGAEVIVDGEIPTVDVPNV